MVGRGPARDTRDRPKRGPPEGKRAPHRRARGVRVARTPRKEDQLESDTCEGRVAMESDAREAPVHSRSAKLYQDG